MKIIVMVMGLLVGWSMSATAATALKRTSVFAEPNPDSAQVLVLEEGDMARLIDTPTLVDDERWVKVAVGNKEGYARLVNLQSGPEDVGQDHDQPSPRSVNSGYTKEQKFWDPNWQLQTSPVGMISNRYNLAVTRFFGQNFALTAKGTSVRNGVQGMIGNDEGYEVGLRGTYYLDHDRNATRVGFHFGAYYMNIKRGDFLGDLFTFVGSDKIRDETKGLMLELMVGPLIPLSEHFTVELLSGLQTYQMGTYQYAAGTGVRTETSAPQLRGSINIEINLGFAF